MVSNVFLDQIQELQAPVGVLFGNRDHQPEVGLHHLGLGALRLVEVLADLAADVDQLLRREPPAQLDLAGAGHGDLGLDGLLGADRAAVDEGRLEEVAGVLEVVFDISQRNVHHLCLWAHDG